jgi:hypothetical protein
MALADVKQAYPQPFCPLLICFQVYPLPELRVEALNDHRQLMSRLLAGPTVYREPYRVCEIHLAVVSEASRTEFFFVNHQNPQGRFLIAQTKRRTQSGWTGANNDAIICLHELPRVVVYTFMR